MNVKGTTVLNLVIVAGLGFIWWEARQARMEVSAVSGDPVILTEFRTTVTNVHTGNPVEVTSNHYQGQSLEDALTAFAQAQHEAINQESQ